VNDFIEECAAFPNGAHDDQVDAMSQALLRWNMIPREAALYVSEYDYERFSQISPI
jgi:phage terminase large subunit-like protein